MHQLKGRRKGMGWSHIYQINANKSVRFAKPISNKEEDTATFKEKPRRVFTKQISIP